MQGTGLNISDSKFQDQLLRINETTVTPPSGPSNYTAGLMKAVSTFRDASNSSDDLKVLFSLSYCCIGSTHLKVCSTPIIILHLAAKLCTYSSYM